MRALVFALKLLLFNEFLAAGFPGFDVCFLVFHQLVHIVSVEYRCKVVCVPHLANGGSKIGVLRGDLAHASEALLPFCNS